MTTTTTKTWAAFLMISLLTGCGMFKKDEATDEGSADEAIVAAPSSGAQPSGDDGLNGTGVVDDGSSTHQACVPGPAPVFMHDVTDNNKIISVTPQGGIGEAGRAVVGRSYTTLKPEVRAAHTPVPIYAPIDMKLIGVAHYQDPNGPVGSKDSWAIFFEVTCKVKMSFFHVKKVHPAIAAAVPGPALPTEQESHNQIKPIEFKAGDKIGEAIGDVDTSGFDFVVSDLDVTETGYANPARYANESWRHEVCPWERFTDEIRDIYFAKLGTIDGPVPGTTCGHVSADVKGSLAGEWHMDPIAAHGTGELLEKTVGDKVYGNPFPIAESPDHLVFISHISEMHRFVVENAEKLPQDILTGTEYCYQLRNQNPTTDSGWAYFQMTSDMEMKVNYSLTGLCPASFPELNSMTYYR